MRELGHLRRPGLFPPLNVGVAATVLVCTGISCADVNGPLTAHEAFAAVAAGAEHTCAIALDGTGYCWGRGQEGQLGDGRRQNADAPVRVATNVRLTAIAAGFRHTCAVTADGNLLCWGWNGNGQLGNGSTEDATAPAAVSATVRFSTVSAGARHTCAVTTGGAAYCWGAGGQGQLGTGDRTDRNTPVAAAGGITFSSVSAGVSHTCGVATGGQVYCWGANDVGQLGAAASGPALQPAPVAGTISFRQVSAGPTHTCGASTAGQAYCWGGNEEGELGLTTVDPVGIAGSAVPAPVFQRGYGGISLIQVSAGLHYSCAVSPAGSSYCWGRGAEGQTAEPSLQRYTTPRAVIAADGTPFSSVSAGGGRHTCGLTPYNGVYCWGSSDEGALGLAAAASANAPTRVVVP